MPRNALWTIEMEEHLVEQCIAAPLPPHREGVAVGEASHRFGGDSERLEESARRPRAPPLMVPMSIHQHRGGARR